MRDITKSFIKKSSWVSTAIGVAIYLIHQPKDLSGFLSIIKYSVILSAVIMLAYERKFWRCNPFEKVPKLHSNYIGILSYNYKGNAEKKEMEVKIKQTLLSTRVILKTNEIRSHSVTANLIFENEEYVLYYIYQTIPKSEFSQDNPIQYGACRFIIDDVNELNGNYWTLRKTIGDLHLKAVSEAS